MNKIHYLIASALLTVSACSDNGADYEDKEYEASTAGQGDAYSEVEAQTFQLNENDAPQPVEQSRPAPAENRAAAPARTELPAGAVRVQSSKIMDRNGFAQPMVAATMLIPVGWKTEGGIVWAQNMSGCGPNTPHVNWTATSPDGSSTIQMLPEEKWSGHNMQYPGMQQSQCPNVIVTDPRQYITQYVQRVRPGAQLLDYRERADIVEGVSKMMPPQPPDMYGMQTRQWVGAGDALLGYQLQGRDMRELVGVIAIFSQNRIADGMGGVMESYMTFSLPSFAYRAPEGQLDFNKAAMIRNSYKADPQWSAKIAQFHANIARTNAKGAADRARITAQTNREISDMQMDSWRRQQESSDRGSREFNEYIRGVETYNDPINGGSVQLDNTYDNAWQLNDGTYVLTDDPSFNPYAATGQDGQRLEPTQ
ncbi:MAG: hypothetical protein AAF936_09110 [Pseudomonadota bacterium]